MKLCALLDPDWQIRLGELDYSKDLESMGTSADRPFGSLNAWSDTFSKEFLNEWLGHRYRLNPDRKDHNVDD